MLKLAAKAKTKTMTSRREPNKDPKESKEPRRKKAPARTREELLQSEQSWGSEAASRHGLFVPVAYPVRRAPTAVAEAVVEPAVAIHGPSAPAYTDLTSSPRWVSLILFRAFMEYF